MFKFRWFALTTLVALSSIAHAAPHCPGNVASVHARHVAQYLNIVEVSINHAGPYPFLLDTGAQITSIDPALAAALQLKPHVAGEISGVSSHEAVPLAEVDDMQVGGQSIPHAQVAIQSLNRLQAADPSVRGVLGGDFLRHFDVLIDQANGLVCLGRAGQMRSHIHGDQLAFATPHAERGATSTEPLIIAVRLSGMPEHPLFLLLDSGANAPFLWKVEEAMRTQMVAAQNISAGQHVQREFTILPPQDMRIGALLVHQISFATPAVTGNATAKIDVNGLLPTAQFRRVYIDYERRFVVLEPW